MLPWGRLDANWNGQLQKKVIEVKVAKNLKIVDYEHIGGLYASDFVVGIFRGGVPLFYFFLMIFIEVW